MGIPQRCRPHISAKKPCKTDICSMYQILNFLVLQSDPGNSWGWMNGLGVWWFFVTLMTLMTLPFFALLAAGSTPSVSVWNRVSLGVESQHQFRGLRSVVVSGCGILHRLCETNLAELSNRATCENATCRPCSPCLIPHFLPSICCTLIVAHVIECSWHFFFSQQKHQRVETHCLWQQSRGSNSNDVLYLKTLRLMTVWCCMVLHEG